MPPPFEGPSPGALKPSTWGWLLAIGFILFILPGLIGKYTPYTWLVGDGGFYLNMQKSLTWFGTLEQSQIHPHSWYSGHREINDAFSNIALGTGGEWWPKHGYVMPIVALPFYWIFGGAGTLVFNVLSVTGVVILSYALACRFAPAGPAAVAAFTMGVVGPHVDYAYNFSNDGFYTVLVLGAFLAGLGRPASRAPDPTLGRARRILAGALLGLAIWTKITNILFAPLLWLATLGAAFSRPDALNQSRWRLGARVTVELVLGAAIPLSLYGAANWYMFGRPWVTSYQRVLIAHGGKTAIASHAALFTVPLKDGLDELLFARERGLLTRYALTSVAWLGLGSLLLERRARAFAAGFAITAAVFIWFFARFKYYHERFLFPYFGLLVVPAARLLQVAAARLNRVVLSAQQRVALVLATLALAASVALIGAWTNRGETRLSAHVETARVYLGEALCDYFNNMRWSWECDGSRGEEQYIGVNANQKHPFGGVEVDDLIYAPGHESRRPVQVVFPVVTLRERFRFRFGLDDKTRPGAEAEVVVRVREREVLRRTVSEIGTLFEAELATGLEPGDTADIIVSIRTRDREQARLCFDGLIDKP